MGHEILMLISVSYPFLDVREFYIDRCGKLARPRWDLPDPNSDFLRSIGPIRERRLGPIDRFLDEAYLCEARRLLCFPGKAEDGAGKFLPARSLRQYERIFLHTVIDHRPPKGQGPGEQRSVTGRFELGLIVPIKEGHVVAVAEHAKAVASSPVLFNRKVFGKESRVFALGGPFGRFYEDRTYSTRLRAASAADDRPQVLVATPAFIICESNRLRPLLAGYRKIFASDELGLYHGRLQVEGKMFRSWVILHSKTTRNRQARVLRAYLTRLYCEHQSLRLFLRNMPEGERISTESIENFVLRCTKSISRLADTIGGRLSAEAADMVRDASEVIQQHEIEQTLERAKALLTRANPRKNIAAYLERERRFGETQMDDSPRPLRVFISYAHEDEELRRKLETQLAILQREGLISTWQDRKIAPGQEWAKEIGAELEAADLVLLLVSADFLASGYINDVELKRALERHEAGEARVIPIILRPSLWQRGAFAKLQALPTDAEPVTSRKWGSLDEAFFDVAQGLARVIEDFSAQGTGRSG